jgi:hypothetical protein
MLAALFGNFRGKPYSKLTMRCCRQREMPLGTVRGGTQSYPRFSASSFQPLPAHRSSLLAGEAESSPSGASGEAGLASLAGNEGIVGRDSSKAFPRSGSRSL